MRTKNLSSSATVITQLMRTKNLNNLGGREAKIEFNKPKNWITLMTTRKSRMGQNEEGGAEDCYRIEQQLVLRFQLMSKNVRRCSLRVSETHRVKGHRAQEKSAAGRGRRWFVSFSNACNCTPSSFWLNFTCAHFTL
jgi:hypothetical protein